MNKVTLETRIQNRMETWSAFDRIRDKMHTVRRLVAGDAEALNGSESTTESVEEVSALMTPGHSTRWANFLIANVEEGRANHMLQAISTLTQQVAHTFPDFEFENLTSERSAVMSMWLKWAMAEPPNGCSARHEMRLALLCYLIDGSGWAKVALEDDKPVIRWLDTLDVIWDMQGRTFGDMRWAAYASRQPLGYWLELGKEQDWNLKPLDELELKGDTVDNWDQPVEVRCYYDVEGDSGNVAHWLCTGEGTLHETPLHIGRNPYTWEDGRPFLPLESCYHLQFPSCMMPISVAERMIPAQVAIWQARANIRDQIDKGRPWMEYEEGAYKPEELQKWADGEDMAAIARNKGFEPMVFRQGEDIPSGQLQWHSINEQEITKQSGVNPYSGGVKVEDTKFASEVNAIQQASGLVAATVSKDFSEFWIRCTRKFLAVAAKFDDRPFKMTYRSGDDQVVLTFDESNPVRDLLDASADIVVREDSVSFTAPDRKIASAMADIQTFMNPMMMQLFPNALGKAVENYLRAKGEKNIKEWMEKPPPMPMMPPGMPPEAMGGMEDPTAAAMASTMA